MHTLPLAALITGVLTVAPAAVPPGPPSGAPGSGVTVTAARFGSGGTGAVNHRPDLVPPGARITVVGMAPGAGGTSVLLVARGLLPGREYGAHVHVAACGPDPADAGPHYQDRPDPVQPSTDPAYANPDNEVWLDLTTDDGGNGFAAATVEWVFREGGPRSVVLHETHTGTDPGHAGTAGDRLACVTTGL